MKKVFFAVAIAAAVCMGMVSCKEEAKSCYKIYYTIPEQPEQKNEKGEKTREARPAMDYEGYRWCTDAEMKASKEALEKSNYQNVSYEKVTADSIKTQSDCLSEVFI
ncbi:MAG: hypothetical protein MJZ93_05040 [Paludibacteraceae bacterium]|nr:hypothetical protein [Paludibacteraceae bacterium]